MIENHAQLIENKVIAVAPMMAWTDRHCRFFHRLFSQKVLLFTEMISTSAITFGQQHKLLEYSEEEHPVAVQFGGSEPEDLARCTELAHMVGFDEVNLNVGCPSPRVQRGAFGACLMKEPDLVAECVKAMNSATDLPVTVKCRLGLGSDESTEFLNKFVERIAKAGCKRIYVHARIAILEGLSAAQNRSIPPLQPEKVKVLKETFPELEIVFNGGLSNEEEISPILSWADGVMIGRAAYQNPELLFTISNPRRVISNTERISIFKRYLDYMTIQLEHGEKLNRLTRPLLNCFSGMPGARKYRQILSDTTRLKSNNTSILNEAVDQLGFAL
jgi:tRNA-dihydrouridine synthase A|tara:strand:- start:1873 stop:2862 length:990 start_codon:yes stop_codon:yes gene_type:complete